MKHTQVTERRDNMVMRTSMSDGVVYTVRDGKNVPVGTIGPVTLECEMDTNEDPNAIPKSIKLRSCYDASFEAQIYRRGLLSLVYGRTVTNNWLKMHGGAMCRRKRGNK